jgi:4-hydroxythreonine-4-phosphate dehydrogenase
MQQPPKPLAITLGDAAGIGPEIIAQAFHQAPALLRGCFVVGDVPTLRRACQLVQAHKPMMALARLSTLQEVWQTPPNCLPVWQVGADLTPPAFGVVSALAGQLAAQAVFWAAQAALCGDIAALVTAPLHKGALALAPAPYSNYPGHTEMLQALAAAHTKQPLSQMPVRMMLANDELRVVLVSIHMALRDAIAAVTTERVLETLHVTHRALLTTLARAPRIAVAGLNPHAGENGLFGREEADIIAPAIAQAQAAGLQVSGPFAPDTVFMRARADATRPSEFDVVVAMYHDQGLIPVKYLGVEKGVNVTLGLALVRTSPDHGTAFDIAGTGRADPSSLLAAIRMAKQLSA